VQLHMLATKNDNISRSRPQKNPWHRLFDLAIANAGTNFLILFHLA